MANIFLSYATGAFLPTRDVLCESALNVGFDEARARTYEDLSEEFRETNQKILQQSRGAGYWLWKPEIILQELRTLQKGDLLVYSDAGRDDYYLLDRFPTKLINLARKNGFLLGPTIGQHGNMGVWTKRDAFVLMDADNDYFYTRAPVQATWSFWTPTRLAFEFLENWLDYCSDPRISTDLENTCGLENLPGYKDHRHDQAVLSILARTKNAPYLDYQGKLIESVLKLRGQSRFSHYFLKRISDAELMEKGFLFSIYGLILSLKRFVA